MKKDLTEIIFVVDRSGSMDSIRTDMIGGFNAFIKEQKKNKIGLCRVSFFQFDTQPPIPEKVFEAIDLDVVPDLTTKTFVPRSGTPLWDAVAFSIKLVGERFDALPEDEKPEKVLMVTITDGEENSSREWTAEQVKQMIEHQTEKYGWQFAYLGANQDAWHVGGSMGVKSSHSLSYVASPGGTSEMFKSLSKSATKYRAASAEVTRGADYELFDKEDVDAQKKEGLKT